MTSLTSLIERIEAATEGSRELDAETMFDLFAASVGLHKDDGGPIGYLWPDDNPSWSFGIRFPGKDRDWFKGVRKKIEGETLLVERDGALVLMNALRVPPLTASIDAALTLLPERCGWIVGNGRVRHDEPLGGARITSLDGDTVIAEAEAATPCLALLAAILRARQTEARG